MAKELSHRGFQAKLLRVAIKPWCNLIRSGLTLCTVAWL